MLIAISPIRGITVGLEYFDSDDVGFGIIVNLVFIRITWYKDIELLGDDDDDDGGDEVKST